MTGKPPSTQPERTALSEQRTGAATLIVGLALFRVAADRGSGLAAAAAVVAVAASLAVLWLSRRSYAVRGGWPSPLPWPRAAIASAAAVGLVSMAGLVTALS